MMHDQASELRKLVQEKNSVVTNAIRVNTKDSKKKARVIAVLSGKGGVGKTNFVINTAIMLGRFNKKVAVIDLDLGLANVDILLNISTRFHIEDVINGTKKIQDILVPVHKGVSVVPGGSGIPQLADMSESERTNFIEAFMELAGDYDYILLDTAAGISRNVIEFVLAADDAIIVTTPEPTAITDAYAALKILSKRSKELQVYLLFNMVQSHREATNYFKKIQQVARQFLRIEVVFLGGILKDYCVHQAIMKRKAFSKLYPFSGASKSLHLVVKKIIFLMPTNEPRQSFLKKISRFFQRSSQTV